MREEVKTPRGVSGVGEGEARRSGRRGGGSEYKCNII